MPHFSCELKKHSKLTAFINLRYSNCRIVHKTVLSTISRLKQRYPTRVEKISSVFSQVISYGKNGTFENIYDSLSETTNIIGKHQND